MTENGQTLKSASRWGMIWGFLTVLFGFFAIGSPFVSGLAVAMFLGISLLAAGFSMTIYAFQAPSLGRGILKFLFGGLTVLVGIAVLAQPGIALAKLTILLGFYFIFDGILTFVVAWNIKPEPGWGWMTFNGAVTLLLAYLILSGWPETAFWAVGMLVGIRLLFAGLTMITIGSAGSRVAKTME